MENLKLEIITKKVGKNGLLDLRSQLNEFVKNNFSNLYEGAIRLNCAIPSDYYAPKRVQIGKTRLHFRIGLKYADGHKYDQDAAPNECQLRQTVQDLQVLINAASEKLHFLNS